MSRREVVFFGTNPPSATDRVRPYGLAKNKPMWPDIDTLYTDGVRGPGTYREGDRDCARAVAFCLAAETDVDAVYLVFDGDRSEPILLTPGAIVRKPEGATKFHIEPAFQFPATRLTSAAGRRWYGRQPALPAGQAWSITDAPIADDGIYSIRNDGDADVQLYEWDGSAWAVGDVVAPGGYVTIGGTAVHPDGDSTERPTDVSPDGVLNFADYISAGLITVDDPDLTGNPGTYELKASLYAVDSNGNAGDPTDPTTTPYVDPFNTAISALYYGVAAVEMWNEEPCGYQPRLPPQRILDLGTFAIAASAVAGTPDQVLITVPSYNVEAAQFTWETDADADADSWATLGSPLPGQALTDVALVTADAAQCAVGEQAAVAILQNIHNLLQVQIGSNDVGAGSSMVRGTLVLTRRHIG